MHIAAHPAATTAHPAPDTAHPAVPEPAGLAADWFLFKIPVPAILGYLARMAGRQAQPDAAGAVEEPPDWHLALRQGFSGPLHLNLGTPGIDEPDHPVEENGAALYAAVLLGSASLPVILSGELETGVAEGLISPAQLRAFQRAAALADDGCAGC